MCKFNKSVIFKNKKINFGYKTLNSYIMLSVKKEPVRANVTRPAIQCFSSRTIVGLYSFKKNSALVFTTPTKEAT